MTGDRWRQPKYTGQPERRQRRGARRNIAHYEQGLTENQPQSAFTILKTRDAIRHEVYHPWWML